MHHQIVRVGSLTAAPHRDRLGWLTVQQLIAYHTIIAVYRVRESKEPERLANFLTRDNMFGSIIIKNTSLGQVSYLGDQHSGTSYQKI